MIDVNKTRKEVIEKSDKGTMVWAIYQGDVVKGEVVEKAASVHKRPAGIVPLVNPEDVPMDENGRINYVQAIKEDAIALAPPSEYKSDYITVMLENKVMFNVTPTKSRLHVFLARKPAKEYLNTINAKLKSIG